MKTHIQSNSFSYLMFIVGLIFLFGGSALCIPFLLVAVISALK